MCTFLNPLVHPGDPRGAECTRFEVRLSLLSPDACFVFALTTKRAKGASVGRPNYKAKGAGRCSAFDMCTSLYYDQYKDSLSPST